MPAPLSNHAMRLMKRISFPLEKDSSRESFKIYGHFIPLKTLPFSVSFKRLLISQEYSRIESRSIEADLIMRMGTGTVACAPYESHCISLF